MKQMLNLVKQCTDYYYSNQTLVLKSDDGTGHIAHNS